MRHKNKRDMIHIQVVQQFIQHHILCISLLNFVIYYNLNSFFLSFYLFFSLSCIFCCANCCTTIISQNKIIIIITCTTLHQICLQTVSKHGIRATFANCEASSPFQNFDQLRKEMHKRVDENKKSCNQS